MTLFLVGGTDPPVPSLTSGGVSVPTDGFSSTNSPTDGSEMLSENVGVALADWLAATMWDWATRSASKSGSFDKPISLGQSWLFRPSAVP